MRDSQKQKVYAAEAYLRKRALTGERFENLKIIDRWVNKQVLKSAWFLRHFPDGPKYLLVLPGKQRNSHWAYGDAEKLRLPPWAWTPLTVLHEISHGVSRLKYGQPFGYKHNWCFTKTFLALIKHFMGKEIATLLRKQYVSRKVKHRKPPVLSQARLAQLEEHGTKLAAQMWGLNKRGTVE